MLHVLDFLRCSALLRLVFAVFSFFERGGAKIVIIPIIFTVGSPKGKLTIFFPAFTSFNSYGILGLSLSHLKTGYLFLILFLSREDEYSRMTVAYSYP